MSHEQKKSVNFVFIPGILCDDTLWADTIKHLPGQHHYNIFDISSCESIEQLAGSLAQTVSSKIILVGFSFGARVALKTYPLISQYCAGLALVSSAPGKLSEKTREHFYSYINQIQTNQFEEYIMADYEHDIAAINKNNSYIKNTLLNMMRQQGPNIAIKQLHALLKNEESYGCLSAVHCPTLLIHGDLDRSINIDRLNTIQKTIPNAEKVIIPNSAHYVPLENPKALALELSKFY